MTSDGVDTVLAARDDKEVKAWVEALRGATSKDEVAVTLAKKKQSAMMSIKKVRVLCRVAHSCSCSCCAQNVSGKAATSGAGKGLIKEELGKNGVRVIDIMKEIITLYEGKKKVRRVRFLALSPL